jgi:Ribbon-helix-helix protein, copG family
MPLTNAPGVGPGDEMVGKSKDPKGTRITVRISDKDLHDLQEEARRRNITVGAVVRLLIRERLTLPVAASG